jgi:hypothetical protein
VLARDYSAVFDRITIYGQRIIKDTGTIFLQGFVTIFNPDGKANASDVPVQIHGKNYKVFSAGNQNARLWKYAEVIQYLLCEYVTADQLHVPDLKRLGALTDNQIVRDLDLSGLSLTDALQRCCERIGIKFKFVPLNEPGMPSQAIVFYKTGSGRKVELNCQQRGLLNISKSNILSLQSKKNFWPVTHRFIGQGDFKVYEATFELIKAWNESLEGNIYEHYSPSTNPNFYQVRDVHRKWALNEAGDYCCAPYNRGNVYDLSTIFESKNYVSHRRRFYPSLTTDSQNRSLGYYLQISFDEGLTWRLYRDAYNLLMDECGVWLSSDHLDIDLIIASMKNKLKFRITASVVSDERLTAVAANGPVNSASPVVDHVVTLPRQFRYQKISGRSIFAGSNDSELGMSDEEDDTNSLYEFVRHICNDPSDIIETIDVETPILAFDYGLGDIVVTSPESRDLLLCYEKRSVSTVENVLMNFQNQCTHLKIIRKKVL